MADLVQDPAFSKELGAKVKNEEKISSSKIREFVMSKIGSDADKMNFLKNEWETLFKDLKIDNDQFTDLWFDRVRDKYVECWRFYHNLNHIYQLLKIIE